MDTVAALVEAEGLIARLGASGDEYPTEAEIVRVLHLVQAALQPRENVERPDPTIVTDNFGRRIR